MTSSYITFPKTLYASLSRKLLYHTHLGRLCPVDLIHDLSSSWVRVCNPQAQTQRLKHLLVYQILLPGIGNNTYPFASGHSHHLAGFSSRSEVR